MDENAKYKILYEKCIKEKKQVIKALRKRMERLNELITEGPKTDFEKACNGMLNNARAITYVAYKEAIELIENGGEEKVKTNEDK